MDELGELLERQSGVISRSQVLALGLAPHDIRRKLRHREWARVHDGVYVDHTGTPTWLQRCWAAVLLAWPAALCHESAVRAASGPGRRDHDDAGPIHVAVVPTRTVRPPGGIVVHRLAALDTRVLWNTSPPRMRIEEAALDVAAMASTDFAAVALLADVVHSRLTTARRLLDAVGERPRISRRPLITAVLHDVMVGACSALEQAYLDRVERAHGLPAADRQVAPSSAGPLYRDVVYRNHGLVVELDGRLFHSRSHDRDRDIERDLDAAVDRLSTIRLGWGQAVDRPCSTARKVGTLLNRLGWTGQVQRCPACAECGPGATG